MKTLAFLVKTANFLLATNDLLLYSGQTLHDPLDLVSYEYLLYNRRYLFRLICSFVSVFPSRKQKICTYHFVRLFFGGGRRGFSMLGWSNPINHKRRKPRCDLDAGQKRVTSRIIHGHEEFPRHRKSISRTRIEPYGFPFA